MPLIFRIFKGVTIGSISILLLTIVIFGFAYKYDRNLFYRADNEITYELKVVDRVCNLSSCNKGIKVLILNSGNLDYPKAQLYFSNLPNSRNLVLQRDAYPYFDNFQGANSTSFSGSRNGSEAELYVKEIPRMWMVEISYSLDKFSGENYDWSLVSIELRGRGSILEENPRKVAGLMHAHEFCKWMFRTIKRMA
jgi:hypothetical protein